MDRTDRSAQGKLALCHGYENVLRADSDAASVHAAQADFEDAVSLMPRSPDPHLGLARIYVYSLKNIGKAMAELHAGAAFGISRLARARSRRKRTDIVFARRRS